MDPQYEQRLREDVIYLHSLWHRGPPRPPASAAASVSAPPLRHNLEPSKSTQFKKEKKPKRKRGKRKSKNNNPVPESNSSPGPEWPCPTPPPPTTGWPSFESKPDPKPISISPEEQLKVAGRNVHHSAIKAVHEFFRSNRGDESDATDSSSDEDGDESMEEDDEFGFFSKVFDEDRLLREYYEKNFAKGEFSCLVCGAVGSKNSGKKFKGCLALVQHSVAIGKTRKRRAHKAFGGAVCKVLGWDIDRLSSVVSMLSGSVSGEQQGNANSGNKDGSITIVNNVDSVEGNNGCVVPESRSLGTGILSNGDEGDMNSLTCPGTDTNLENASTVHPHIVEEPVVEGSTSNSLASPDADKNLDDLGILLQHITEEHAEGLASNSLSFLDDDKNLEDLGIVHQNIEEPSTEVQVSVPLDENNGAGNEMQDLQTNNAVVDGQKEDNETEN